MRPLAVIKNTIAKMILPGPYIHRNSIVWYQLLSRMMASSEFLEGSLWRLHEECERTLTGCTIHSSVAQLLSVPKITEIIFRFQNASKVQKFRLSLHFFESFYIRLFDRKQTTSQQDELHAEFHKQLLFGSSKKI